MSLESCKNLALFSRLFEIWTEQVSDDRSYLTVADVRAQKVIVDGLR